MDDWWKRGGKAMPCVCLPSPRCFSLLQSRLTFSFFLLPPPSVPRSCFLLLSLYLPAVKLRKRCELLAQTSTLLSPCIQCHFVQPVCILCLYAYVGTVSSGLNPPCLCAISKCKHSDDAITTLVCVKAVILSRFNYSHLRFVARKAGRASTSDSV